jgi:O-antigen/teichoic acid export membrane protein
MSIEIKAAKGVTWLALFQFSGQGISWVATVIVARILAPDDYGLMEMATLITGYAFIFNELGLGHAIIQSPTLTEKQTSSIFWFSTLLSLLFALFAIAVAYPTALIFSEPKVIPLTQTTSILFILSGLQIVPGSLLHKDMKFRTIGFINMISVLVSCISMVIFAKLGVGVWTLIGGHVIRSFMRLVLVYFITGWKPILFFNFQEARKFILFGVQVAIGRSLFYIFEKSDRFFAGRAWEAKSLGLYSFALELASIPTEKIVPIINQVSYSAFAALQNDRKRFNAFYLNITKTTASVVLPIFCGGFLLGDDLVRALLTEQWYSMIPLFRCLCLVQIFISMTSVNQTVHSAQGKPGRNIILNTIRVIFMPLSFFIAVQYGLNAILVPWFTTYMIINITWAIYTLKKINVSVVLYFDSIKNPSIATTIMALTISFIDHIICILPMQISRYGILSIEILVGISMYGLIIWKLDSSLINKIKILMKK